MARSNKNKPSHTAVKKALMSCVFNPREPGPMAVIADMWDNPVYLENRAIEFLRNHTGTPAEYEVALQRAISLLGLSLARLQWQLEMVKKDDKKKAAAKDQTASSQSSSAQDASRER